MKEPDKIYVSIGYEAQTKPFHHSIEYIRKGALLEWIDEYKNYSSGPSWELLKTHIETL